MAQTFLPRDRPIVASAPTAFFIKRIGTGSARFILPKIVVQMNSTNDPTTEALLGRVRSFCFPAGEDTARLVRAIRVAEKGELRSAPGARWIPFTAEETIESTRSSFRWEARYAGGRSGWIGVTDAYEDGHGRLAMKLGGLIPIKTVRGPHADRGELQRYLASVFLCPPMLLNHGSLEWSAIGPTTLRVRDSAG